MKRKMNLSRANQVLFIALAFLLASCSGKESGNTKVKAKFVKVEQVDNDFVQNKILFNGKVKEKSLSTLSFRVGGPLIHMNVKSGDYVNKGEVIAAIDKRDYELQVQTRKAQYEQSQGEYERYKELFDNDKIPANSFEKVESGYLMAQAAYNNAVNQLNDTELKAPYSGYIYEKNTENHQTVGAGVPIVSIMDLSELEIVIAVPENLLKAVKGCSQSFLTVENANVKRLPVSMLSISEKTKKDGLYEVKFVMKNTKGLNMSPGMSAEITMYCNEAKQELTVPSSAIFTDGNKTYVWIYSEPNKTVKKQPICVGNFVSGGLIPVLSGINVGDTIVVAGVHSITDGQLVEPIKNTSETNIGGLL